MLRVAIMLFALVPVHALAFCDGAPYQVIKVAPCGRDELSIYGVCHIRTEDQRRCSAPFEFRWRGNVCVKAVWEDCKRVS